MCVEWLLMEESDDVEGYLIRCGDCRYLVLYCMRLSGLQATSYILTRTTSASYGRSGHFAPIIR